VNGAGGAELLYLYALVRADEAMRALEGDAPNGIGEQRVHAIAECDLAAIVGPVPAAEFEEAPLNASLSNIDWLAPRAAAHQHVNALVSERTSASLPLSFGTVFRSEDSLRGLLRARATELIERLDAVRGCSEWVVTVSRDSERAEAALAEHDPELARARTELEASSPGRRYLLERQMSELRRRALRVADAEATREIGEAASRTARRMYAEPLVAAAESGAQLIARSSALVDRAAESQFWDALEDVGARWRARGYDVERSGPWPPYRFGGTTARGVVA